MMVHTRQMMTESLNLLSSSSAVDLLYILKWLKESSKAEDNLKRCNISQQDVPFHEWLFHREIKGIVNG